MPRITAGRAKEQRDRILDATLTCFARDGFNGATIQDIVKESDLSPGAIYGYFKSKAEMATAIASARHVMERSRMKYALSAPDVDPK